MGFIAFDSQLSPGEAFESPSFDAIGKLFDIALAVLRKFSALNGFKSGLND